MPKNFFKAGKNFLGSSPASSARLTSLGRKHERRLMPGHTDEATKLRDGGVDGIIIENFGDAPFRIGQVDPETVAGMTLVTPTPSGN